MIRTIVAVFLLGQGLLTEDSSPKFENLLKSNPSLTQYLTVKMVEYGGDSKKSYTAPAFDFSALLRQQENQAIFWATARPPTEATKDQVGLLVLAKKGSHGVWSVQQTVPLEATGKYAGAKAVLTSNASEPDYDDPVVTVTLDQGGRGYSYSESFTYLLKKGRLVFDQPHGI